MATELEVLIECLRPTSREAKRAAVERALSSPAFDAAKLLQLALRHRLSQQLAEAVGDLALEVEPLRALEPVRRAARSVTLVQLRNIANLLAVAKAFDAAGIPYLVLKGAPLAVWLYGAPERRQSNDIDVLVPKSCLGRAESALESIGYRYSDPDAGDPEEKFERHLGHVHHLHYGNGSGQVELHWDISSHSQMYPKSFDALYSDRQEIRIADCQVTTLGDEDMLRHLLVHGTAHAWNRMKLIYEIALIRQRKGALFDELARAGAGGPLAWAFALARALADELFLAPDAPPSRGARLSLLRRLARYQIENENGSPDYWRVTLGRSAFILLSQKGARAKFRFLGKLLSWTPLHHALPLPKPFRFLYPILGPFAWAFARAKKRLLPARSSPAPSAAQPRAALKPSRPAPPPVAASRDRGE